MPSQTMPQIWQPETRLFDAETLHATIKPEAGIYIGAREVQNGNVIALPRQECMPRVLEPRWYQEQAQQDIDARFASAGRKNNKGELLVCPTGCGKTVIASSSISKWKESGKRVLLLVDMERLLDQMQDDLTEEGIYPLIEKAQHSALKDFGVFGTIVLASMQTLYTKRLQTWPRDSFDIIVIDEAHELRWLPIIEHFNTAQFLGLTATPQRADGKSLKKHFNYPYIRTLTLREGIEGYNAISKQYEKPFLSRILVEDIPADHIDLSLIKVVGADFDQKEIDREIWNHTNWIASQILEKSEGRPTWIYCPRIPSAIALAEALRDMGAKAAPYTSQTPNPREVLQRFIRGDLNYLTNVNMLIKGVNVPKVACIAQVTPSLTPGPVTQKIGRGTRLSPQTGKENVLVLQFNFKTGEKQRLASIIDAILDGADEPDEKATKLEKEKRARVRERTDQILRTREELDLIKAFDLAKQQLGAEDETERQRKADKARAKYEKVDVQVQTYKYDPCAGLDKKHEARDSTASATPATSEQLARLKELLGNEAPLHRLNEAAAAERIAQLETRKQYNYASEKQLRMMINLLGCDPRAAAKMKKWDASTWIDGRRLEMVQELSGHHGFDHAALNAKPVWEVANLHRKSIKSTP